MSWNCVYRYVYLTLCTCIHRLIHGMRCCFHSIVVNRTYGQESYEPAQVGTNHPGRPLQTVIPQQHSDTMCTSIFCRYLLPVIGANESIIDVFKHVKEGTNKTDSQSRPRKFFPAVFFGQRPFSIL